MAFTKFSLRNIHDNDTLQNSCKSSALFKWCPIDIVLWLLMLCTIGTLLWKLYCDNQRKKLLKYRQSTALPYPQSPPEKYEAVYMKEQDSPTSTTPVDPFLVINTFDNSLISRDSSFKSMAMPEPALQRANSANPSTPSFLESTVAQPLPLNCAIQPKYDDKESTVKFPVVSPASPPPAYVRTPRWEA